MLQGGATLKEINLPENTLVMMVYRDGDYSFTGSMLNRRSVASSWLFPDRGEELESTYKDMESMKC